MTQELHQVHLLGLPLDVYRRSAEHHDELQREFALITEGRREDVHGSDAVPARLLALIADLIVRFSGFTAGTTTELRAAAARGDDSVDLTYLLPPEVGPAAQDFDHMLDEADEFCRAGDLLTLATPPDVLAFRRWFLGEFVAQLAGAKPTPWPDR